MKRLRLLMVLLLTSGAFSLAGCNDGNDKNGNSVGDGVGDGDGDFAEFILWLCTRSCTREAFCEEKLEMDTCIDEWPIWGS